MRTSLPKRILQALLTASCGFGMSACFGGLVSDGTNHQALNNAQVEIRNCDGCGPENFTTGVNSGLHGTFVADVYAGGPYIHQRGGEEAIEVKTEKAGYHDKTIYKTVKYSSDKTWSHDGRKKRYDNIRIQLFPDNIPDSDGDGLYDDEEIALGTDPWNADTDGDALPDGWEVHGHNFIDLKALGADPLRKDVFVEIDYMTGFEPDSTALGWIVDSFANAPVSNPDGSTGISLHVQVDDRVPLDPDLNPAWVDFDVIKNANFNDKRAAIFHYCIFGSQHSGGSSSGLSRGIEGSDFIVSLGHPGWANTPAQQAGTFMHELGHNLGLRHGGDDNVHRKPNYLSVMNYSFQTTGLTIDGAGGNFDYSRFELSNLNEGSLNESQGLNAVSGINEAGLARYATTLRIGGSNVNVPNAANNIDYNQNGFVSGTVSADVNGDGMTSVLSTHNDWENLVYDGGGLIGAGAEAGGLLISPIVIDGDLDECLTPDDL